MNFIKQRLTEDRRNLHRIPEIRLELPKTVNYLKNELSKIDYPYQIIENEGIKDSFLVFFDFGYDRALAFRTDMDALPVLEQNEVDFKSTHTGNMHACGHDGHMAMLLEFARQIPGIKDELESNIVLIFQAGEESPGGASLIMEQQLLEKLHVKAVFGIHLWPSLPLGQLFTKSGAMMSKSSEITIEIHGRSTHASRYKQGIDAALIGAEMLLRLYEMIDELPEEMPRLLRFGSFHAGSACNAIADKAILYGTLRAFSMNDFEFIQKRIKRIARELEEKYKTFIDLTYTSGYPPLINDANLASSILKQFADLHELPEPDMASEDFSFYLEKIPGVFFFLGVEQDEPLHSSRFNFDESVLEKGVDLYVRLAKSLSDF